VQLQALGGAARREGTADKPCAAQNNDALCHGRAQA